ncbi:MAG: PEP-CTERM sorting domain-containing protein, partial [Phycisphaerae bacterium]
NMERKESFMFSIRPSVISRGSSLGVAAIAALAMLSVGNAQANLITNGDFSSGLTDWTTSVVGSGSVGTNANGPTTLSPDNKGNTITNYMDLATQLATDTATAEQTFAVTGNTAYLLSLDLAGGAGESVQGAVTVLDNAGGGMPFAEYPSTTSGFNNTQFTLSTYSFTTDVGATSATLQLSNLANKYTVPASFDVANVSVTAVPEPATLGLVMAGGLGLLLLKRRKPV